MFAPATYTSRRTQLQTAGLSGLILFMGNVDSPMNYQDNIYPFVQDASFRYFFGLNEPGLAGVIDLDQGHCTLFGHQAAVEEIIWTGAQPSLAQRAEAAGLEHYQAYDKLAEVLSQAHQAGRRIHYLSPYRGETLIELGRLLDQHPAQLKAGFSAELTAQVVALREIKSAEEISQMESALQVTRQMHLAAMQMARPGVWEYEIVGVMEGIARRHGLHPAYPFIFSRHGEVLHNQYHNNILQQGDLALNDSGANSLGGYASDITRTLPVGGKFSTRQSELYDIVLEMAQSAIAVMQPGIPYLHVHQLSARIMVERLSTLGFFTGNVDDIVASGAYAIAFPHGLGHQIGLDVHDMEALGEDFVGYNAQVHRSSRFGLRALRLGKPLQAGMVVTVEPGVYFIPALIQAWEQTAQHTQYINYAKFREYQDAGGIRIEDNVLVTANGARVLGPAIPKTRSEIEAVMG